MKILRGISDPRPFEAEGKMGRKGGGMTLCTTGSDGPLVRSTNQRDSIQAYEWPVVIKSLNTYMYFKKANQFLTAGSIVLASSYSFVILQFMI